MFAKDNILTEINSDIGKKFAGDIYKARLVLFQFFKLKYKENKKREYIGYILFGSKNDKGKYQYTLDISEIGTLNAAGILEEVKQVNYNDNYFAELLEQFYSPSLLKIKLQTIINQNDIPCSDEEPDKMLSCIINYNQDLLKTYNSGKNTYREEVYFPFRFFKLSEKYAPYEAVLWEALKEEFFSRLNLEIVRRF